ISKHWPPQECKTDRFGDVSDRIEQSFDVGWRQLSRPKVFRPGQHGLTLDQQRHRHERDDATAFECEYKNPTRGAGFASDCGHQYSGIEHQPHMGIFCNIACNIATRALQICKFSPVNLQEDRPRTGRYGYGLRTSSSSVPVTPMPSIIDI